MSPKNLLKIIEEVRKFDDQMEAQAIAVFFYVGTYGYNDGVLMQQIQKDLSLGQSSVSRNVYKLADINRHKKKAIGFLYTFDDPMERRRKKVALTSNGKRVFNSLKDLAS